MANSHSRHRQSRFSLGSRHEVRVNHHDTLGQHGDLQLEFLFEEVEQLLQGQLALHINSVPDGKWDVQILKYNKCDNEINSFLSESAGGN